MPEELVLVELEMDTEFGALTGMAWGKCLNMSISHSLQAKGLLLQLPADAEKNPAEPLVASRAIAFGRQAYATFWTTDRMEGLRTVQTALRELKLLDKAQIAWKDWNADHWRYWFPDALVGSLVDTTKMDRAMLSLIASLKQ